jgi:hypothetical protein
MRLGTGRSPAALSMMECSPTAAVPGWAPVAAPGRAVNGVDARSCLNPLTWTACNTHNALG